MKVALYVERRLDISFVKDQTRQKVMGDGIYQSNVGRSAGANASGCKGVARTQDVGFPARIAHVRNYACASKVKKHV